MGFFVVIAAAIRTNLKSCMLLLILLYYIYISFKFNSTNNFRSSLHLCMSQNSHCPRPSETISLMEIADYNGGIYNICVEAKNIMNIRPCFSSSKLDSFLSDISSSTYTNENLLDYIKVKNDYMYYVNWVVALCIIGLILTVMFENSTYFNSFSVNRAHGTLLNREVQTYLRRMMIVVLCMILLVMIRIIAYYSLKYRMNCIQPFDDKKNTFCTLLEDNDVHINSLIYPTGLLVKPFKNISIVLVAFLLFGLIIYKENPNHARSRNNRVYVDGVNELSDEEADDAAEMTHQSLMDRQRLSAMISVQSNRQQVFSKMKVHRSIDSCNGVDECSICLGDLFPKSNAIKDIQRNPQSGYELVNDDVISSSNIARAADTAPADIETGSSSKKSEGESLDEILETDCGHIFHKSCILKWYVQSSVKTCPVCRAPIK